MLWIRHWQSCEIGDEVPRVTERRRLVVVRDDRAYPVPPRVFRLRPDEKATLAAGSKRLHPPAVRGPGGAPEGSLRPLPIERERAAR